MAGSEEIEVLDEGSDDEDRPRTVRLPFHTSSAPAARRLLREDLESRGVPAKIVDEAEAVVAELVSNALSHAKPLTDGCVRLHWKVKSPIVDIEVSDGGGPNEPKPAPETPYAPRGRGLRIVRSLAHEWGVNGDHSGRTVWACLGGPSRRRTF